MAFFLHLCYEHRTNAFSTRIFFVFEPKIMFVWKCYIYVRSIKKPVCADNSTVTSRIHVFFCNPQSILWHTFAYWLEISLIFGLFWSNKNEVSSHLFKYISNAARRNPNSIFWKHILFDFSTENFVGKSIKLEEIEIFRIKKRRKHALNL